MAWDNSGIKQQSRLGVFPNPAKLRPPMTWFGHARSIAIYQGLGMLPNPGKSDSTCETSPRREAWTWRPLGAHGVYASYGNTRLQRDTREHHHMQRDIVFYNPNPYTSHHTSTNVAQAHECGIQKQKYALNSKYVQPCSICLM